MTDFIGHGWRVGTKAIHVGTLPGRKSICLYFDYGSVIRTIAFFRNDKDARECLDALDSLATGHSQPPPYTKGREE